MAKPLAQEFFNGTRDFKALVTAADNLDLDGFTGYRDVVLGLDDE